MRNSKFGSALTECSTTAGNFKQTRFLLQIPESGEKYHGFALFAQGSFPFSAHQLLQFLDHVSQFVQI